MFPVRCLFSRGSLGKHRSTGHSLFLLGTCLWLAQFWAAGAPESPATNGLPSQPLSLAKVKEITFERNWDLLTAKSGIDASTAQFIVAKEFPNPTASFSVANFASHDI